MPDAKTEIYGVLGYPINYTRSPQIHNDIFAKKGKNAIYLAFPTKEDDFETFIAFAKVYLKGFNVTIPYKEKILPYLEDTDISAKLCGAVNTVKVENGKLFGFNTDGAGGKRCIEKLTSLTGKTAVIKGSGGAARGLAAALCFDCRVLIDARSTDKAKKLIRDIKEQAPEADLGLYEGQTADIIINATDLGSTAQPGIPFTEKQITEAELIYDAVYDPPETELITAAEKLDKKTVRGLDMLIGQALLSQEIYTKQDSNIHETGGLLHRKQAGLPKATPNRKDLST